MNVERCSSCRFWKLKENSYGDCRRYPPVDFVNCLGEPLTQQPETSAKDWCGEYVLMPWVHR